MKKLFNRSYLGQVLAILMLVCAFSVAKAQNKILNNGYLRMGNGVENSVNTLGNVQQPFYFNSALNVWRKLTYSTYPLDYAVAVSGDKTNNWNINGTIVQNPVLSGQVIDYSGYIATSATTGYGVIKSTGSVNIGGKALRIEQIYTLPQASGYIGIKVRVTNIDATIAENVRVWVGTRDDWVGDSDRPRKQRGNIVNGAFAPNTTTAQQALAIKISTATEAVLVYTNSTRGHTSVSSCCSFANAYNQNPATSTIDITNDGSYAFYVRMNDLAPNQSDEFTWYYAAGSLADIEEIINEVAQASGSIQDITCNTATYNATASANGTGYWAAVTQGSPAPTAAQIKAGTATGAVASGSAPMVANVQKSFNITGLSQGTNYTVYFVHEDAVPQFSAIINTSFSTIANTASISASGPTTFCAGGSVTLTANSGTGLSYQWNNNGNAIPGATNSTYVVNTSGSYTVTVSRAGCPDATSSVTAVTVNALPQPVIINSGASQLCAGNTVTLSASTSYSGYVWSPGGQTTSSITVSTTGNYVLTATNAQNCSAASAATAITVNPQPAASYAAVQQSCTGSADGQISVTATAGTAPYQYSNDGGTTYSTSNVFSGLGAGSYSMRIKDANGCESAITLQHIGLNLVTNGDFEAGNTGFSSSYGLRTAGIINEGQYEVTATPVHPCFTGPDHTSTGTKAFYANGSGTPNTTVWTQTISNIQPNTVYYFSAWVNIQCDVPAAVLQFSINGTTIGAPFSPATPLFTWQQFFTSWNSGSNTTATIRIVNQSTELGGNDFGIDDIFFTTVAPLQITSVAKTTASCITNADASITVSAQGGTAPYQFSMNNGASFTAGSSPYSFTGVAPGTYTIKVKDNCGIESNTQTVTVIHQDTIRPVAVAQDATVYLGTAGSASVSAAQINNGSSDNCSIESITVIPASFSCANVGSNTVTLRVKDVNGNISTATATVTVLDTIAPSLSCPNNINVNVATPVLLANYPLITNLTDAQNTYGAVTLTGRATDPPVAPSEGTPLCQNGVYENGPGGQDIRTPIITGLNTTNFEISVDFRLNGYSPNAFGNPVIVGGNSFRWIGIITGQTGFAGISYNNNFYEYSTTSLNLGQWYNARLAFANNTARLYIDGNLVLTVATGTLVTGNNLNFTTNNYSNGKAHNGCIRNLKISNGSSLCGAIVAYNTPSGTDNCPGVTTTLVSGLASGSIFPVGTTTQTYRVADASGNSKTCSFNVTVTDNVLPSAKAQDITLQLDASGNASTTVAAVNNGSSDACGIKSVVLSKTDFNCSNVGANTVTLTVTDNNDNVSTTTATVTVQDNIAPTAIAQNLTVQLDANGTASVTPGEINNGSSDNCSIDSITVSPATFNCSNVGNNTVTLRVKDVNGNVSTATATVTVQDNIAPAAIAQNITVELNSNGSAAITPAQINNGSYDNCAIDSITVSPNTFDCSNVGNNTVTLRVKDVNGNVSTATATVIVQDNIAPVAACKNLGITLANGSASITPAQVNNGSYDACGIKSLTLSKTLFTCADIGTQIVTLTVTDNNNNVSTCQSTVTVTGTVPTCSIASAPNNTGTVIGSTTTYAAVNQMFLGYGAQSMNITCTANGAGPFTYSWTGTGLSSTTISNPVFTPVSGGNYTLTCTVTNSYGCQTTCSITICVIDARGTGGNANNPKVTICHVPPGNPNNPQTLNISVNAVSAHLGQHGGDKLGACNAACGLTKTGTVTGDLYSEETVDGEVDLIVYPNPSSSKFNFKLESESQELVGIKVFDMAGRLVVELAGLAPQQVIVLDQLQTAGVYTAHVTQGSFIKVVKITKVN